MVVVGRGGRWSQVTVVVTGCDRWLVVVTGGDRWGLVVKNGGWWWRND